ncbi:MAG: hypothetical protein ACI84K_001225 [Pseudohongiellaceae bacterium]|jgi:hypothetical protein
MKKTKRNPVAKHLRTYNKAVVHVDFKKKVKKGYRKHRLQDDAKVAA